MGNARLRQNMEHQFYFSAELSFAISPTKVDRHAPASQVPQPEVSACPTVLLEVRTLAYARCSRVVLALGRTGPSASAIDCNQGETSVACLILPCGLLLTALQGQHPF
jgi:hypothetical protein